MKARQMTPMIRPAVPDDLPQVHQMIGLLARHPGTPPAPSLPMLHRQTFDLGLTRIWVAAEPEGLVGCAVLRQAEGQDPVQVYVHEWRRRAGIGRALTAAATAKRDQFPAQPELALG
jgi:hypothetical protein